MDYTALDEASFAENSEPRCAVVLLLDTSTSMEGDAIDALVSSMAGEVARPEHGHRQFAKRRRCKRWLQSTQQL